MRRPQGWSVLALAALLGGCHQTLQVHTPREAAHEDVQQVTWSNHFLLGFVGRSQVDLRDYCRGAAVERVQLSSSVATVALTVVTLGIYCPRRVTVTCNVSASP